VRPTNSGVLAIRRLPAAVVIALALVATGCDAFVAHPDRPGAKPSWPVPITTEAQAIEAAKFISRDKVGVEIELVDRGTLAEMNEGFVGGARFPTIPEVDGVRTDDVWRVEVTFPPSGRGTLLFHGPTGVFLIGLWAGLDQ
jgi:hypothetical protein